MAARSSRRAGQEAATSRPALDRPLHYQEIDPCRPYRRGRLCCPHHAGLRVAAPPLEDHPCAPVGASAALRALRRAPVLCRPFPRSQAPCKATPACRGERPTGVECRRVHCRGALRCTTVHYARDVNPAPARRGARPTTPRRCSAVARWPSTQPRLLAADGLFVNPVLDTYRMHSAEVGRVVVRAGQHGTPAELLVLVQQCEDVDGSAGGSTGPLVSLHEPQWWSEDFTLDEAEQLAELLRAARDLVAR